LERKKRYSHRQYYFSRIERRSSGDNIAHLGEDIDYLHRRTENVVYHIYDEIRIFEVKKQQQIHRKPCHEICLTPCRIVRRPDETCTKIVEQYGKDEHEDKESRCLAVEKKSAKHQKRIAKKYPFARYRQARKDYSEECPEIKRRKEQRQLYAKR